MQCIAVPWLTFIHCLLARTNELAGMGHRGQLARSPKMTMPDANGNFDLGKEVCYHQVVDEDGVVDYQGPNKEIITEKFLKPAPPNFAGGQPFDKMIVTDNACGGQHLLVIARVPGELASQVYSSGLNNYGQLGHGDANDGTAVNTDRHEVTLVSAMSVKDF